MFPYLIREVEMRFEIQGVEAPADGFPLGNDPAFAVQAGTRLITPARVGIVGHSTDLSMGFVSERYHWPMLGETRDHGHERPQGHLRRRRLRPLRDGTGRGMVRG